MKIIEQARQEILDIVIEPAIKSNSLDKEIKNKVQSIKVWINQCKHTGDLYHYIRNLVESKRQTNKNVFNALIESNLIPVEHFAVDFLKKYEDFSSDKIIYKLEEKSLYSGHEVALMSRNYDLRTGINILRENGKIKAVFSKVDLEGESYSNSWIDEGVVLKHAMFSRSGVQKLDSVYNSSILNSSKYPVHVFIKSKGKHCYFGEFICLGYFEEDAKLYFKLSKKAFGVNTLDSSKHFEDESEQVEQSRLSSSDERKKRLRIAKRKPEVVFVKSRVYKRDPDVVVETLERAKGICERCSKKAPFIRASNNTPYLEVHHIVTLATGGLDILENTIALCPNCHRELHFGIQ